jgi:hypothetical protein
MKVDRNYESIVVSTEKRILTHDSEFKFPLEINEIRERGVILGLSEKAERRLPTELDFSEQLEKFKTDITTIIKSLNEAYKSTIESAKGYLDELIESRKNCKQRANDLRAIGISHSIPKHLIKAGYAALIALVFLMVFIIEPIIKAGENSSFDLIDLLSQLGIKMNQPIIIAILILPILLSLFSSKLAPNSTNKFVRGLINNSNRLRDFSLVLLVLGAIGYYLKESEIKAFTYIVGVGFASVTVSVMTVFIYSWKYKESMSRESNLAEVDVKDKDFRKLLRCAVQLFPEDKWSRWLIIIGLANIVCLGIFATVLNTDNDLARFRFLSVVPLILYLTLSSLCLVIGFAQKDIFLDEGRIANEIAEQEAKIQRYENEHKMKLKEYDDKLNNLDREYRRLVAAFFEGYDLAEALKQGKRNSQPMAAIVNHDALKS